MHYLHPTARRAVLGTIALLATDAGCAHRDGSKPSVETAAAQRQATATLLLKNGVIFTARDASETVEALAIAGDRILAAGSARELARHVGPSTRAVDLRGRFVCPGFHDAHLHFESGGRALTTLDLSGLRTLEAVLQRVKREVADAPPGSWIVGRGWDHTLWPGQRWPTREDLDRVAPDHPVYLRRVDGHVAWVNSRALAVAGIDERTPDPPGGEIARQPGGRRPSGLLKENAITLAKPRGSAASSRSYLLAALSEARKLGITSIQDGGSSIEQLQRLRDEGKLTVRVDAWGELDADLDRQQRLQRSLPRPAALDQPSKLLVFGALKGFVDGTLGSGTAALLEPYADQPAKRGILTHDEAQLRSLVRAATRRGFQVALHAIGDQGVRRALRAFEAALADGAKALRHRVEHVQVIHPDDLKLFARTGSIASIQPCHLSTDQRWVDRRLGRTRAAERGYVWRRLADSAPIAIGTDWPVEPLSPLRNLYVAITRRMADPPHGDGWNTGQRLAIGEALRAYTHGSAYAAFAELRRGTLEPGKDADLVVIDRDLLRTAPEELLEARVLATVLAGRVVHGQL